jgi:thioredoxin-like negative regulator of GroEL
MNTNQKTNEQLLDEIWHNLRKKDLSQAVRNSNLLTQESPDFAPGWYAASHVAQLTRQPESALTAIDRALDIEPANIEWLVSRAGCLLMCGDSESSRKTLLILFGNSAIYNSSLLSSLAYLCSRVELYNESAQLHQRLIDREPKNGGHWYNLASVQRLQGQIEQAEASLDKAIGLNPEDYQAYQLRSDLRKQTSASNHVSQLQNVLKEGIKNPSDEVQICYALAKENEDIGDSEASFKTLSRGAALRRKHINYSINDDTQTIDAIISTFHPAHLAAHQDGYSTREPIFVIGLPRTGITLVERILASHSAVFAAGELKNFAMQMMKQLRKGSVAQSVSPLERVQQIAQLDTTGLGRAYLESSRPLTGQTPYFVDKMPLNFLYAGLIHQALPQAKIIHPVRDPMETCYAIYKHLFQSGYPWSYDLNEIAAYYLAYRRLMAHWNKVIPGVIHELAYEDLVTDPESPSRELLKFCDLPWESQCLHFDETPATSTTASLAQARQPIDTSSVHRWRDYQQQLAPLVTKLCEGGIQVD